jgi:hypothetical protein
MVVGIALGTDKELSRDTSGAAMGVRGVSMACIPRAFSTGACAVAVSRLAQTACFDWRSALQTGPWA